MGAGTGILSAVCARLGARRVYAVEASSIASDTEQVMRDNGLDGVVRVLNSRVEDLEFLPDFPCSGGGDSGGDDGGGGGGDGSISGRDARQVVDVIVSEWMGTLLVAESMMQSVLYARNMWLRGYSEESVGEEEGKEGKVTKGQRGVIIPSIAELFLAPISARDYLSQHLCYWNSKPYGIDLSAVKARGVETFVARPVHSETVKGSQLFLRVVSGVGDDGDRGAAGAAAVAALGAASSVARISKTSAAAVAAASTFNASNKAAQLVARFDLADASATPPTVADNFGSDFYFSFVLDDRAVDGFVAWFDVSLYGDVTLSTSPLAPTTHWRQAQLLYPEPLLSPLAEEPPSSGEEAAVGRVMARAKSALSELKGRITVVRNAKWPRHYEVAVEIEGGNERRWKMWR